MNTEHHQSRYAESQEPRHLDVSFEERDVRASTIYKYLFALAVAVVASFAVCILILKITTQMAVDADTPPPASRSAMGKKYHELPPEPRLQGVPGHTTDPQQDWRTKLQEDTAANEKTQWVNQTSGIAQIPVRDAMKMIAEKGLPGAAQPAGEKK